jgi:N-acylneuraminate cytidylyltransferase
MKPFVLGAIFARGGSKGVPGKNIRPLAGKPLIAYAIEVGKAVAMIDRVIVSTDSEEIAQVARQYGADVPFMRPPELAGDDAAEILAWKHAVTEFEGFSGQKVDIMVSIPTTSPLREAQDVRMCLQILLSSQADVVITVSEAHRNPYFNMVTIAQQGDVRLVIEPRQAIGQRQKAPKVYDMTTVAYAIRADFLRDCHSILEGKVRAVEIPRERALDIDTLFDFELAEFLMRRKVPAS